jgi:predicted methyltransferase
MIECIKSKNSNRAIIPLLIILATLTSLPIYADEELRARLEFAMSDPSRPENDLLRDPGRKPVDVLEFIGIKDGMTVLEIMAGTGYYTELLSAAVGSEGNVYAQNDVMAMRMRYAAIEKAITTRLQDNRLNNVQLLTRYISDLDMLEAVDAATLILNLHDLYIYGGEELALNALSNVMKALKPGGILGIVDHNGSPDQENKYLHRIDMVIVEELLYRAGFVVTGRSDILRNPEDTLTLHVFDPEIRGNTDRFLIRAMKPMYISRPLSWNYYNKR